MTQTNKTASKAVRTMRRVTNNMQKRWIASIIAIASLAVLLLSPALVMAEKAEPSIGAQAAILIEQSTGKVLFGQNAHQKLPMASTTKIMTALIAIERGNLDDIVTTASEAYGVEGSSMYIQKNEKLSLKDLVYGLMLNSGNDAAIAIAIHIGGSIEGFADLMNERALSLGLANTHFVTPNGLHDPEHYTSAFDLAAIAREAMNNETFREIAATSYYSAETGNVKRTLKSKNKILWQYEGGNGIKTGYTEAAGKCLVFSAKRADMELIGVVLNSPDIFPESMNMLDYGFEAFSMARMVKAGDLVARVKVNKGSKGLVAVTVGRDIVVPVKIEEGALLKTRVVIPRQLDAPLEKGVEIGTLELWDETRLVASEPLVAMENIDSWGIEDYFNMLLGVLTGRQI